MQLTRLFATAAVLFLLQGCHSAFIEATLINRTPAALSVIQVDYPSASFGTQTLAAGAVFHYRFKVLGNGATHLTYTDAAHAEQHSTGPALQEGDEGSLTVAIASDGVDWQPHLHNSSKH